MMEREAMPVGTTVMPGGTRHADGRPQMPGPPTLPGAGWYAYALPRLKDPVLTLLELQAKYGDIVSLGRNKAAPILVFGPENNHTIMSNPDLFYCLDTSSKDSPIRMPEGSTPARLLAGVTGMNGPKHLQHRRLLMPAFHKKRVEALRDVIVARVQEHMTHWRPGMQINLAHEMLDLSLSLAISSLLGLDPTQEGKRVRYLLEQWSTRGLSPQVALLPYNVPGLPYRRFLHLSDELQTEFKRIIAKKRQFGTQSGDALSLLLDAQDEDGGTLTEDDLLGHLSTLFTAGHETTASSLTWTFFLLAQHPQVMQALMEEMDSKLAGSAPTMEQMYGDLPVLDGVVNESLRMFPPGMWIIRTSTAPFQLGPYHLPKGTHIILSPAATHYRAGIYREPHRFMPERWRDIEPNTYEYMPFGGGPRRCLGATFAQAELKLAIPMILQQFRIEVPEGARVDRGGTILSFPKGGLDVVLREQDRQFETVTVRGNIHDLVNLN
ncbi:MAG: cytochrome P450 [Chloroflexota bacterium]